MGHRVSILVCPSTDLSIDIYANIICYSFNANIYTWRLFSIVLSFFSLNHIIRKSLQYSFLLYSLWHFNKSYQKYLFMLPYIIALLNLSYEYFLSIITVNTVFHLNTFTCSKQWYVSLMSWNQTYMWLADFHEAFTQHSSIENNSQLLWETTEELSKCPKFAILKKNPPFWPFTTFTTFALSAMP